MTRIFAALGVLALTAGAAHAESFFELGGHWAKADSTGLFGGQIDSNRADLTTTGAYFGAAV